MDKHREWDNWYTECMWSRPVNAYADVQGLVHDSVFFLAKNLDSYVPQA